MRIVGQDYTFGLELEVSDVPSVELPSALGRWDNCERDIVNTMFPYRGIAADPLGISPPVGGEINVVPTRGFLGQVVNFCKLQNLIGEWGVGPSAHTHIHVGVPGLWQDSEKMKRLIRYIRDNQEFFITTCGRYEKRPGMDGAAVQYMKFDGGRRTPTYLVDNLLKEDTLTHERLIDLHCRGKDGISRGRPFRYGINLYASKFLGTVEFRMFRGTSSQDELDKCLMACALFLESALSEEAPRIEDVFARRGLTKESFPPMLWDQELWDGLKKTKHPENRGKKDRRRVDA